MSLAIRFRPLALVGLFALAFTLDVSAAGKGKKYALLIGVTEYDSSHFSKLNYAENDVEKLAGLLRNRASGFAGVRLLTTSRGKKNPDDAPTAANIHRSRIYPTKSRSNSAAR